MTIPALTSITGGAQTGFTSPTYTSVVDRAPDASSGVQNAVTVAGGTQVGVRVHSPSDPFTITFERPKSFQALTGLQSGLTGLYGKVGENVYKVRVRKGVNIAANNLPRLATITAEIRLPAGADAYDAANIRAMLSAFIGALDTASAGFGDTLVTGVL